MSDMRRFDLFEIDPPEMTECLSGDWVRYEDAAPLLEAGAALLDFVRGRFPDDFRDDPNNFKCRHHRALVAAIAKATGGE